MSTLRNNISTRPNVLYMDVHDLGTWLGCYGKPYVSSPHIDRLAGDGARFTQFISSAPICMPSRVGLYAGIMPHMAGVMGQDPLDNNVVCMAEYFRRAGYATFVGGGINVLNTPEWAGFTNVLAAEKGERANAAVDFLRHEAGSLDSPFFLSVSFQHVHRPFGEDYDPDLPDRIEVPGGLPDEPETRKDLATLCRKVEELDKHVGEILGALEEAGAAENTIVIFTTEHGIAMPRHKHTLYNGGIHTALLLRAPGRLSPGLVYDDLLSNMDLLPTLLELAGLEAPPNILGRSFLGLLEEDADWQCRDAVFSEQTWGRRSRQWYYTPMRSIRTERFHYIHSFREVPAYVDNSFVNRFRHRREVLQEWFSDPLSEKQLFDLKEDPDELANLADSGEHKELLDSLHGQLFAFLERTEDPILEGYVRNKANLPDITQWLEQPDGSFALEPDNVIYYTEEPF